jgi:hypothetical protein
VEAYATAAEWPAHCRLACLLLACWNAPSLNLPFRSPQVAHLPRRPLSIRVPYRHLIVGAIFNHRLFSLSTSAKCRHSFRPLPTFLFYTILPLGTACPLLSFPRPIPLLDHWNRVRTIHFTSCFPASRLLSSTASRAPGRCLLASLAHGTLPLTGTEPAASFLAPYLHIPHTTWTYYSTRYITTLIDRGA